MEENCGRPMLHLGAKGLYIKRTTSNPCTRSTRLALALTSQASASGKNSRPDVKCVLIDRAQLFLLETALNIHEKGLLDSKAMSDCKE